MELLSPAGTFEKLKTALYFGADAVYFAGKKFGLRAFAGNFENDEIFEATQYAHSLGKKVYITVNIIAHDSDFEGLDEYLQELVKASVDGVIVADIGVIRFIKKHAPSLNIHVSTQANVINSESANFFAEMGVKRIVLARELSLEEIKVIRKNLPKTVELECFVHGAMCISYSGRCLLSNYLCNRDSNRGACVQACRWQYYITEVSRKDNGENYEIQQDEKGTYILNSKDLNMIKYIKELEEAGVESLKIEGRMKSPYYVANVTNAYKRALNCLENKQRIPESLNEELYKTSHRNYTTGFYFGANDKECLQSSYPVQTHEFMAVVLSCENGIAKIEQRNRFKLGDELEVLSPNETFNQRIIVKEMFDEQGNLVEDAKVVQQIIYIKTNLSLKENDILRKKI